MHKYPVTILLFIFLSIVPGIVSKPSPEDAKVRRLFKRQGRCVPAGSVQKPIGGAGSTNSSSTDYIGSDICGDGGCKTLEEYCSQLTKNGQHDARCDNVQNTNTPTGSGCPVGLKSVCFNSGYNTAMFDTIGAADNWTTFGMTPSGSGTSRASSSFVPMMKCPSEVDTVIKMVNDGTMPDWMLTFNELDYSYGGFTCTATAQEAGAAMKRLVDAVNAKGGVRTQFVAPITADALSDWLPQFYQACGCREFFAAYSLHIYQPSSAQVIGVLNSWRAKYDDKPTWVTELAPGNADPPCSLSTDTVGSIMKDVYAFAKKNDWIKKIFWNTGNQIGPEDHNVCNSYLLDRGGNPNSALLDKFKAVDCS